MKHKKESNFVTVYSTEHGSLCPTCGHKTAHCTCKRKQHALALQSNETVRVRRETKGRKGKTVTIITGVPLDHGGLLKLAQELKQKCGSGGTVKDSAIELQGDHRDRLIEELKQRGYTVKRAGG